jgi:nicotinamide mononucleotide transporter
MIIFHWITDNYIELFGAVTGIIYVFLEIRQNIWLWPVGIITSAVYIWVFFTGKLYADMSLQVYYLVISCMGWYWWVKGTGHASAGSAGRAQGTGLRVHEEGEKGRMGEVENMKLEVTRLKFRTGMVLGVVFIVLFTAIWLVLTRLTDSPVPVRDSFITSMSIIATWMLARKIFEHWFLWIAVNSVSVLLFFSRGLYPTIFLYIVYCIMSFAGLAAWRKTIKSQ